MLQVPLLLGAVVTGVDPILRAVMGALDKKIPQSPKRSRWSKGDLAATRAILSETSFCNLGTTKLVAEIGLRRGEISAMAGHLHTALFELDTKEAHPGMGGGLLCRLSLPHVFEDQDAISLPRLYDLLGDDRLGFTPPHFGAWCAGDFANPVYISFLPNALHFINGLAATVSLWAQRQAEIADAVLRKEGIHV